VYQPTLTDDMLFAAADKMRSMWQAFITAASDCLTALQAGDAGRQFLTVREVVELVQRDHQLLWRVFVELSEGKTGRGACAQGYEDDMQQGFASVHLPGLILEPAEGMVLPKLVVWYAWMQDSTECIQGLLNTLGFAVAPSTLLTELQARVWQHELDLPALLEALGPLLLQFDNLVRMYRTNAVQSKALGGGGRGVITVLWWLQRRSSKASHCQTSTHATVCSCSMMPTSRW